MKEGSLARGLKNSTDKTKKAIKTYDEAVTDRFVDVSKTIRMYCQHFSICEVLPHKFEKIEITKSRNPSTFCKQRCALLSQQRRTKTVNRNPIEGQIISKNGKTNNYKTQFIF